MIRILVLFYSRNGSTLQLARQIARGVDSVPGAEAILRTVPPVAAITEVAAPPVPLSGCPYLELAELEACDGLLLGSPVRFGNMAAPLKALLDSTSGLWLAGALAGKPAGVFTSGSTPHGGQESTLLSMMLPLLHHGMLIVGLPFTDGLLTQTRGGGTPYGASHLTRETASQGLTDEEGQLAFRQGQRVAEVAAALATGRRQP